MVAQSQQGRPDDNLEFGVAPAGGQQTGMAPSERNQTNNVKDPYARLPNDLAPGEDPPSRQAGVRVGAEEDESQYTSSDGVGNDAWLIQKAYEIYTSSTDYLDANITNQWERNLAHFHNEHAPGANFRRTNFRRSSVFRPKTRANVKRQEAALAVAAFSTADFVDIRGANPHNETQKISAAVVKELLQYRLDRRMRWFQTMLGAWQDTKVYGVCITYQHWRYEVDTDVVPALDDDGKLIFDTVDGNEVPMGRKINVVRKDELVCDNIAPENFRFDPMCDWRDPGVSSPYLIYMMPMYAGTAVEYMEKLDPKTGQPQWKKHSLAAILGTRRQDYERTRQAREGRERIDPADEQHGNAFTTVWAHMNIIKVNGTDMVYWTMGTELLLTEPMPLKQMFPWLEDGQRPFRVGFSTIETHRNYPAGDVEQTAGLQEEINLVSNQRLDNVKLALNKRYYVRRGSQIDLDALIRNVPGGGVFMNDPEKDIKTEQFQDVTSSSYQEQDRLSLEFDDIAGAISQQSQQGKSTKQQSLGESESVGAGANMVQDYGIKIFFESWFKPVMRDLTKLVQMYETDEASLALVGERLQLAQKFGMDEITDTLLMQDLVVKINVGMGNTDPVRRVERLVYGVTKVAEIPGMVDRIKGPRIADEIFGSLGYEDSSLFFTTDEEHEQLTAENPPQDPPELQVKKLELEIRREDNQARDVRENSKRDSDFELRLVEIASKEDMTLEQLRQKLDIESMRDQTTRDSTALKERNKATEMTLEKESNGT